MSEEGGAMARKAVVEAQRDVERLAELFAQLRGNEQTALRIDRVLVFSVHSLSPRSIFIFSAPLSSTSLI